MKFLFAISTTILLTATSSAQNLVSNPSFSDSISCPSGLGQINLCTGWHQPTDGTADYFNACATSMWFASVPVNFIGYQTSPSNAYAGIITYNPGVSFPNYREYLSTTFQPLEIGKSYKVTITVSLADSCGFATNGLGVFFTTYAIADYTMSMTTSCVLPVIPQVDYSSYSIIADKDNWVTLTKYFVADSAYTNLTIGCFKADSNLSIAATPYSSIAYNDLSYYYVDSVAVEKKVVPSFISNAPLVYGVSLAPNPFNDHTILTINCNTRFPATLNIYNVQGNLVRKMCDITTESVRIERGDLMSGFYYYKLYGENGVVGNGKFAIQD